MTYKELIAALQDFSAEELDKEATIFNADDAEYYPITDICKNNVAGVLDAGHPYLEINSEEEEEENEE